MIDMSMFGPCYTLTDHVTLNEHYFRDFWFDSRLYPKFFWEYRIWRGQAWI